MYDELIKRLREDKSWVEQGTTQTEHEIAEHIQQAADAIEELTGFVQEAERDRDEYRERLDKAADAIEELSMKLHGDEAAIAGMKREIERMVVAGKPRWIPVTERLPEHDRNVLICYEWTGRSGTVYREVGIASIEELERDPTELFRPLYWMPLPEPPKEET